MPQSWANPDSPTTHSITVERMMVEKVEQDIFKPPCHKLKQIIKTKLAGLLKEYDSVCQRWNHHWNHTSDRDDKRYRNLWTSITKAIPNSNETLQMGQGWNKQTPNGESNTRKLIKLVSTHHSCSQGQWRETSSHDYCALNKVTQKFIRPMPKVEDIFSQLNGAKYFSTFNLQAGYHHISLDETSIPQKAFTSPFGKYEYIKVPFGPAEAPAYFQELMTGVLKRFLLCHHLPGWHHHLQQNSRRTPQLH